MSEEFERYSIEYGYGRDGARWALEVMATSAEDAMERVKTAAAWGTVSGVVVMTIPAAPGSWLPRLICWIANLRTRFQRSGS